MKRCIVHKASPRDAQILSVTPAAPGWSVAFREKDGTVWTDPVAAWALMTEWLNADETSCTCEARAVVALVTGDFGALTPIEQTNAVVVPPEHRAEWNDGAWEIKPTTGGGS